MRFARLLLALVAIPVLAQEPSIAFGGDRFAVLPYGALGRRQIADTPEPTNVADARVWRLRVGIARSVTWEVVDRDGGTAATHRAVLDDAGAAHLRTTVDAFAATVARQTRGRHRIAADVVELDAVATKVAAGTPQLPVPIPTAKDPLDRARLAGKDVDAVVFLFAAGDAPLSARSAAVGPEVGPDGIPAFAIALTSHDDGERTADAILASWAQLLAATFDRADATSLPSVGDGAALGYDDTRTWLHDWLAHYAPLATSSLPRLDAATLTQRTNLKNLRFTAGLGYVHAAFDGIARPLRATPATAGERVPDNQLTFDRESLLIVPFRTSAGVQRHLVCVRPDVADLFEAWLMPADRATPRERLGVLRVAPANGTGVTLPLVVFETALPGLPNVETDLLAPRDEKGSVRAFVVDRPVVGQPLRIAVVGDGLGATPALSVRVDDDDVPAFGDGIWRTFRITPSRAGPLSATVTLDRFGTLPICVVVEPAVVVELAPATGSALLTGPSTPFVVTLRNQTPAAVEVAVETWLPPELRCTGLPPTVRIAAGAVATQKVALDVEPDRPSGRVDVRLVVRPRGGGDALGEVRVPIDVAVGRDRLRHDFESPARRPGRVARGRATRAPQATTTTGEWTATPQTGGAAVGAGFVRVVARGDDDGGFVVMAVDGVGYDPTQFRFVTGYVRRTSSPPSDAPMHVVVDVGSRRVEFPLPPRNGDDWQRFAIDVATATASADAPATKLATHAAAVRIRAPAGATFDLDDVAIVRAADVTDGDRLRSLTERFAAGLDDANAAEVETALATIDAAALSAQDHVDLDLLRHALAWRRIEPTLPRKTPGEPGGEARLVAMLAHQHHLTETPDELAAFGRREIALHQQLLQQLAEKMAPGSDWRTVAGRLRDDHPTAEALPALAERYMRDAMRFTIERGLITVPMAARDARVNPVTTGELSRTYAFGGYGGIRASPDGYVGTYFVSPPADWMNDEQARERLRGNHRAWTQVVALHEVVPGHHLQTVVHAMRPLSTFRRGFYSTVFAEGWALYCEELMHRSGWFTDDATRFTQLQMRLWRAVRVLVDVELQRGAITKAEAERLFVDEAALDPVNAHAEVLRDVDHGTRPLSYLLGFRRLEQLVEQMKAREGAAFRLDRFLDRVLAFGPVPLPAIERALLR